MISHTDKPSTQEAEVAEGLVWCQPGLHVKTQSPKTKKLENLFFVLFVCMWVGGELETEPKMVHILDECSTTELHLQTLLACFAGIMVAERQLCTSSLENNKFCWHLSL